MRGAPWREWPVMRRISSSSARDGGCFHALTQQLAARPRASPGRTHILPETAAMQPPDAAADLFLLRSAQESTPHVILEAMAAGPLPAAGGIW